MEGLDPQVPVLVVDDSPGIRAVMESYLRRLGLRNVRSAESVEAGLAAFHEQGSEIVFLDMVLDGEEVGVELAARALEEKPFTTIVVMSALPRSSDLVTSAIAEGVRHVLAKPVRPGDVRAVLDRVAEERREAEGERPHDATYG